MQESEAMIVLRHCPHLHSRHICKLIELFGSAREALFKNSQQIASVIENVDSLSYFSDWEKQTSWKRDLALVEKHNVHIIPFWHENYPKPLLDLKDFPPIIYVQGTLSEADQKAIAMVGTRACTMYGREMAFSLARACAHLHFTVISGLARGIDTWAHLGALETGRTIAVIGSGLGKIYPSENEPLAAKISQRGAIISEFPMEAFPAKHHFPRRNRLVCALSLGVLLIEAPLKSGAMITMNLARLQKKICFAIPGRADMDNFRGNHSLIKTSHAQLVENVEDMISVLNRKHRHADLINHEDQFSLFAVSEDIKRKTVNNNPRSLHNKQPDRLDLKDKFKNLSEEDRPEFKACSPKNDADLPSKSLLLPLDPDEENLLEFFPASEISLEELSLLSKLCAAKLNSLLMGLVLKQKIREFPGKTYKRTQKVQ